MGCISKGQKRSKPRRDKFPLPELGDDAYVWIRSLSSTQLLALQDRHGKRPEVEETNLAFVQEVLALCAVNDDGSPLYDGAADVAANLEVDFPTLKEMVKKCFEISGIETAEKN
jgi:hypothetical protein